MRSEFHTEGKYMSITGKMNEMLDAKFDAFFKSLMVAKVALQSRMVPSAM